MSEGLKRERAIRYRIRHADKVRAYQLKWRAENKHKVAAHTKLARAIKRGDLKRISVCEKCDSRNCVDAHHHDYSKPLDVHWLCRACHFKEHGFPKRMKKRVSRGDKHAVKLNGKKVISIRKKIANGFSLSQIARDFDISVSMVWLIDRRKSWNSV